MCGRFSNAPDPNQKKNLESWVGPLPVLPPRYNIAPTEKAFVITNSKPAQLTEMEWGLVPSWSKHGNNTGKLINARAETLTEKPSFTVPLEQKRCIVVADSFYEWRKLPGGRKIPYRILLKNGQIMFMAGLWDVWGANRKKTFTIITTTPNSEMVTLHSRMPVILPDETSAKIWLGADLVADFLPLLQPISDDTLRMYPVSEKLNKAGYESPGLHTEWPDSTPDLFSHL